MYPTVCSLMQLWGLTAESVQVDHDSTSEVQELLDDISLEDCFKPGRWPGFVGIAEIDPAGDIVPVRARYGATLSWLTGIPGSLASFHEGSAAAGTDRSLAARRMEASPARARLYCFGEDHVGSSRPATAGGHAGAMEVVSSTPTGCCSAWLEQAGSLLSSALG